MRAKLVIALALGAAAYVFQSRPDDQPASSPWIIDQATLAPGAIPGSGGIQLLRGIAYRPDLVMEDGVIQFRLAPPGAGFAGVAFRMASAADYEIIYFRPSQDGQRWSNVQYQPVFEGETTWQLYHGEGYEAAIPRSAASELQVRLLVAGRRADVFVGDNPTPVLRIHDLKRAPAKGGIGFWAASDGDTAAPSELRALEVDATTTPALSEMAPEHAAEGQLVRWHVSPRATAPGAIEPPLELPAAIRSEASGWPLVTAEASGLVNLTQALGNPAGPQRMNVFGGAGWGLAYAHVGIDSDRPRTARLLLSYSDGIGVYVNGRRVFAGRNDADSRYDGYLGIVGREVDEVGLPLARGPNDVVLAVTDKAFGWGFRARLGSADGLIIRDSR